MENSYKEYHKALLTVLNNIGIIGAILASVADIVFVIIFVVGVNINIDMKSAVLFAIINSLIGLLINILLRYQGIKYAEIENQEIVDKFYSKKIEDNKKPITIELWQTLQGIKDFFIKGITTVFSIFGIIYISIQGSKNPIQLLITLSSLILFACFGLISMNSSYKRYHNLQIPYMKLKIKEKEDIENGNN